MPIPPPWKCTTPGNSPPAGIGWVMYNAISLPSTPVIVVVMVATPVGLGNV